MKTLLAVDGGAYNERTLSHVVAHDELLGPGHEYTLFTVVTPVPPHAASFLDRKVAPSTLSGRLVPLTLNGADNMRNFTYGALAITVAAFFTAALLNVAGTGQAVAASHATGAASFTSQTSNERGVTIKATPINLATDAKTWDFEDVFDSHTQDLTDDVVESPRLLDGAGGQHRPFAWDGNPPGGHHRKGELRFKPLATRPQALELQVTRPGEPTPLAFRWQLQ